MKTLRSGKMVVPGQVECKTATKVTRSRRRWGGGCADCFSPLPLLPPVSCEGPGGGTHRLSEAPWVPQAGERAILWVRRFLWMFPPQNGIGHGHFVRSFVVIILCGFLECL